MEVIYGWCLFVYCNFYYFIFVNCNFYYI
jgi:hypothetical protein